MFLATSLNEKLKRSFSEIEIETNTECKFPYEQHPGNPAVLTTHKHIIETEPQKLSVLSKQDWEKKFTLPHLRAKWRENLHLNFNPNHKKFPEDIISLKTKEAKTYITDLIDQDTLQIKNKRWNKSSHTQEVSKPELKKTIFEITKGLNNISVVPLKDNVNYEGTNIRNRSFVDGSRWNNSTLFEKWEKKQNQKNIKDKAESNTLQYWRTTEMARYNEYVLPISEERQKFEGERYYKRYKNPLQETQYRINTMNKVREATWLEREKVTKNIMHNNPGCTKYSEKINSLVFKELYSTYRTKYDEFTGKTQTKFQSQASTKVDWKDEDITERIKTINDWKDVNWFKPLLLTENNDSSDMNNTMKNKHKELLKPLVPKSSIIQKEENDIRDKIIHDYKQKMKKEILLKRNRAFSLEQKTRQNPLTESKYPIDADEYDQCVKNLNQQLEEQQQNQQQQPNLKASYSANNTIKDYNDMIIENENNIIPTEKHYNTKNFLKAYKKVTMESMSKERKEKAKMEKNKWIFHQYTHPGTYREFQFKEKTTPEAQSLGGEQPFAKNEKVNAWSCCMNTIETSRGCRKIKINKYKWNLSHA